MDSFQLKDPRYEAMRLELLRQYKTSRYNCARFSRQMAERFPELRPVAGFYIGPTGASHGEHWWLETAAGEVVDPTADQWPSFGTGSYVRYDPTKHLVSKGTCPSCGTGLISRTSTYPCSKSCDEALAEEYQVRQMGGPYEEDMELTCDADVVKYGLAMPAMPC